MLVFTQNVCRFNWIPHNYVSTGSSCVPLVVWTLAIFVRENWAFGVSSQMIYENLVWSISHTSKTILARWLRSMFYYFIRKLTWNLSTFIRKEHFDIIQGKYINKVTIKNLFQVLNKYWSFIPHAQHWNDTELLHSLKKKPLKPNSSHFTYTI